MWVLSFFLFFSPPSVDILKKITIGDFFKPGFSRKVRIQLFLKFFTANRKHSRCLKDYRDKKKRILFYTGGRKNLGFFPIMPRKVLDRVVDSDGFRYFSYKILTINTTYSSKGQWTWRRYNEYPTPNSSLTMNSDGSDVDPSFFFRSIVN